jgi:hypothetical protein
MMKRVLIFVICLFLISLVPASSLEDLEDEGSFAVNSILLKESLTTGENSNKSITIGRGGGQQINLKVVGLSGVSLENEDIVLGHDETASVNVFFNSVGLDPGVYVGSIEISDDLEVHILPVIFEIESLDIFYDGNLDIPPRYSKIDAGTQLVAQLKLFDLTWAGITEGLGANNVDVEYVIYDLEGNVISSESESIVVDKQVNLNKNVGFPENARKGEYVLAVEVSYKSSLGVSSQMFTVNGNGKEETSEGFSIGGDYVTFTLIGVLAVLFVLVLGVFVYLIKGRDQLILDLRNHNDLEYTTHKRIVLHQESVLRKKGVPASKVKKEVKVKLKKIKEHHEKKKKEVEVLSKKGDTKEMASKLKSWKSKGYNTLGMEMKLKSLSTSEMKSIMEGWKKKYR